MNVVSQLEMGVSKPDFSIFVLQNVAKVNDSAIQRATGAGHLGDL